MDRDLPTDGIQYEGSPLPGLAADEAFTYLGVLASLAWAVNWEEQNLPFMEFTRPNDRGERSLHETDTLKTARYTALRDLLASLLPKWEGSILTFSLGIRESYIPDRWTAQLNRLGLMRARVEKLMEGMVSQVLQELTAIYSTRYAAIQHKKAHDE
jgi:hypothetical protein